MQGIIIPWKHLHWVTSSGWVPPLLKFILLFCKQQHTVNCCVPLSTLTVVKPWQNITKFLLNLSVMVILSHFVAVLSNASTSGVYLVCCWLWTTTEFVLQKVADCSTLTLGWRYMPSSELTLRLVPKVTPTYFSHLLVGNLACFFKIVCIGLPIARRKSLIKHRHTWLCIVWFLYSCSIHCYNLHTHIKRKSALRNKRESIVWLA